jgi:hypothetical protein
MNIIFGDAVNLLPKKHLVLELDTVIVKPMNHEVKTWCVVESLMPADHINLEQNKQQHQNLLEQYRDRNWNEALKIISQLKGCWNGEVDSFYEVLQNRILQLQATPPNSDWNGCVIKFVQAPS